MIRSFLRWLNRPLNKLPIKSFVDPVLENVSMTPFATDGRRTGNSLERIKGDGSLFNDSRPL